MNEENFKTILGQLVSIGFPEDLEAELRLLFFFGQKKISIGFMGDRNGDTLIASASILKNHDQYLISRYDVTLRKYDPAPEQEIHDINLRELEARMAEIPWSGFTLGATTKTKSLETNLKEVQRLLQDLKTVEATEETKAIACQLKLEFWEGTSLEQFIPDPGALKAKLEITQRYYIFESTEIITIEEAIRFLNHRWRERRSKADRGFQAKSFGASPQAKQKQVKPAKSGQKKS